MNLPRNVVVEMSRVSSDCAAEWSLAIIEHSAGRIADDARDFATGEGGLGYYRCNANRKDEGQAA